MKLELAMGVSIVNNRFRWVDENLPEYWCSIMAFIDSNKECRSEWLVSFASKKVGADMEA